MSQPKRARLSATAMVEEIQARKFHTFPVELDDLVIEQCVSLTPPLKRIKFELVNRRFTRCFHSILHSQPISLLLKGNSSSADEFQLKVSALSRSENNSVLAAVEIFENIPLKTLSDIFKSIFSRFTLIRALEFYNRSDITDIIVHFVNDKQNHQIEVHQLKFTGSNAYPDWRLIKHLSPKLKVLNINSSIKFRENESKYYDNLWQSIAHCKNLKTFYYCPKMVCYTSVNYDSQELINESLSKLNIRRFECTALSIIRDKNWIFESFQKSNNLRHLTLDIFLHDENESPIFAEKTVEIFRRLRRLEVICGRETCLNNELKGKIHKLLSSLPKSVQFCVQMNLYIEANCSYVTNKYETRETKLFKILKFWLSLSIKNKRHLNLQLNFYWLEWKLTYEEEIKDAISRLQRMKMFADLRQEVDNSSTQLLCGDAKITLFPLRYRSIS